MIKTILLLPDLEAKSDQDIKAIEGFQHEPQNIYWIITPQTTKVGTLFSQSFACLHWLDLHNTLFHVKFLKIQSAI